MLHSNRRQIQVPKYAESKHSKAVSQAYTLLIKYVLSVHLDIYMFIMTLKARVKFIVL